MIQKKRNFVFPFFRNLLLIGNGDILLSIGFMKNNLWCKGAFMTKFQWKTAVKNCYCFLKTDRLAGAFGLLLLTAAVHLWAQSLVPVWERDSITYVTAATHWAATGEYLLPEFPPLPCFMVKVLIQLGLQPETAAKCFTFLTGLPVPLLGYLIAMKMTGNRRVARYTAFMLIFHPMLIYFSVQPLRDSAYILFVSLLTLAAVDAVKKQTVVPWLLCALWSAFSWACRFETLEFFLLLPLVAAVRVWQKSYPWKRALLHLMTYWVCSIVLWIVLTVATGGREVFVSQYNTYIKHKLTLLVQRWKN